MASSLVKELSVKNLAELKAYSGLTPQQKIGLKYFTDLKTPITITEAQEIEKGIRDALPYVEMTFVGPQRLGLPSIHILTTARSIHIIVKQTDGLDALVQALRDAKIISDDLMHEDTEYNVNHISSRESSVAKRNITNSPSISSLPPRIFQKSSLRLEMLSL